PQSVHYYCEQAVAALAATPPDIEAAHAALDAATHRMESDQKGSDTAVTPVGRVRTAMLRAQLAEQEDDVAGARVLLESIVKQQPEFAGMVAPRLLTLHRSEGTEAGAIAQLRALYEQ